MERVKKRKGGKWVTESPKSERSTRTVALPGWLAVKMADYLANEHPHGQVGSDDYRADAPLWPSRKNGGGYRAEGVRYAVPFDWTSPLYMETFGQTIFKPALAVAGLPVSDTKSGQVVSGVRLHDLRHTAAHTWLESGCDFREVSEWLGHADYTVTLTVYADLIKGRAAASVNPAPEPKSITNVVPLPGRTG